MPVQEVLPESGSSKRGKGVAVTADEWRSASRRRPGESSTGNGVVVIAAITSCPHFNPRMGARPWQNAVKRGSGQALGQTSLARAPMCQSVPSIRRGLARLDSAFNVVGYAARPDRQQRPLAGHISKAIDDGELVAVQRLSGTATSRSRIPRRSRQLSGHKPWSSLTRWQVASNDFATGRSARIKLARDVFLKDIWPCQRVAHP